MPCPLVVAATGFALFVPLDGAGVDLPVGSVVRATPMQCARGIGVEVQASHDTYGAAAPIGARGCVAAEAVRPADSDTRFLKDGAVVGPEGACDAPSRPIPPATLAGLTRVRDTYAELFGPLRLDELDWTDWGYVALPLRALGAAAIEAEWAREGLSTPSRREKAVVAAGPAYLHFLGADAPGSDIWATPATIEHVLRLAHAWSTRCGTPDCMLQLGDLAWYNARTPDPLGHRDHNEGTCVDIRLFRTDGGHYEAWWNRPDDRTGAHAYDRARTTEFLAFAMANAPVSEVLFNDPAVIAAVPGVRAVKGHDDHVHMCFGAKATQP
ncbi:MAG: hypothetical protein Q8P18_06310 [Pseudomonadota bacterium]|nr:hypothetical protein [Pseudomonadota bacterium]